MPTEQRNIEIIDNIYNALTGNWDDLESLMNVNVDDYYDGEVFAAEQLSDDESYPSLNVEDYVEDYLKYSGFDGNIHLTVGSFNKSLMYYAYEGNYEDTAKLLYDINNNPDKVNIGSPSDNTTISQENIIQLWVYEVTGRSIVPSLTLAGEILDFIGKDNNLYHDYSNSMLTEVD